MIENLEKLYKLLLSNNYLKDAKLIGEIISEVKTGELELSKKRLIAMCNPKYLGDYKIKEFDSVYEWWNFLEILKFEAEKSN